MNLAAGLKLAAENYKKWAEAADAEAEKSTSEHSWFKGRASVYRQAAIDFSLMASLAEKT